MFHISLNISNLQQSKIFYTQLFGGKPHKEKAGYLKWELNKVNLVISLLENPAGVNTGFGHLGLRLPHVEELQAEQTRLENAGLSLQEEMDTNCCYARQDKFWAKDPDGYAWEMYVLHADTDEHSDSASDCCIPGANACSIEPKAATTDKTLQWDDSLADRLQGLDQEEATALLIKAMAALEAKAENAAAPQNTENAESSQEEAEEAPKPKMGYTADMFAKPPQSDCNPNSGCC
jgi:catechol 2,3-dioxygenase-like lactoylglutathione lyase family enzyme